MSTTRQVQVILRESQQTRNRMARQLDQEAYELEKRAQRMREAAAILSPPPVADPGKVEVRLKATAKQRKESLTNDVARAKEAKRRMDAAKRVLTP